MSYSRVVVEDKCGSTFVFNHVESVQRAGNYIVLTVTTGDITMLPVEQYSIIERHLVLHRRQS